jgi:hypothetical protein
MSRMQRQPWSESEKVSCTCHSWPPVATCASPTLRRRWAGKADSNHSSQIALLVEISRDAQVDPVLSLARGLPVNVPEPRWEEIPLPAGTPRCIYALFTRFPFQSRACHGPTVMTCRRLLTVMKRAKSKILQRRVR